MEDRDWVRSRLLVHEAGLLSPDEEARLLVLVEKDETCRRMYEEFLWTRPEEPGSPRHLSAYRIARWPRMARSLSGLDRELVRGHLASCADCRADITALGFDPVLPPEPATTPEAAAARSRLAGDNAASSVWQRVRELWSEPQLWRVGWALTAAGLAALYFAGDREDVVTPVRPGAAVILRSGDMESFAAVTSPDGRTVALLVSPPAGLAVQSRVNVAILAPDGTTVAELRDQIVSDLISPNTLVIRTRRPLQAGRHRLRLSPLEDPDARIELPFEVAART